VGRCGVQFLGVFVSFFLLDIHSTPSTPLIRHGGATLPLVLHLCIWEDVPDMAADPGGLALLNSLLADRELVS
jgi:hypothetical protein